MGYSPWGRKESDTMGQLTLLLFHFYLARSLRSQTGGDFQS